MTSGPIALIRADASIDLGTGHVMRCLTVAELFRRHGLNSFFVCREHQGNLFDVIEKRGFTVLRLPVSPSGGIVDSSVSHTPWLGTTWQEDAKQTVAAIYALRARPLWLLVDHYALDCRWESAIRPFVGRILVLDDLADRQHDCDALLDSGLDPELAARYATLVGPKTLVFLGPRYALLREEFDQARARLRQDGVRKALVFFGGSDPSNETLKLVQAWRLLGDDAPLAKVVLGPSNPHKEAVLVAAQGLSKLSLMTTTDMMASLMAEADLGIGACGVAALERCALGLPSLVAVCAENQRSDALLLSKLGAIQLLGDAPQVSAIQWAKAISDLQDRPASLVMMSQAAAGIMHSRTDAIGTILNTQLTDETKVAMNPSVNHILLINTAFPTEFETFYHLSPPLGLISISAALKKAGYYVTLIDPQFDDDYRVKIQQCVSAGILFAGMSVFMGPNLHNAVLISRYIEELSPSLPIVWGGPLATSSPAFCLEHAPVDYIVMGMGEYTVVALAGCLAQGADPTTLAHVSYRSTPLPVIGENYYFEGDLDELAFPDLRLWDYGVARLGKIPILSSRGCPRNCAFCYNNTFNGRKKWYQRSCKNVIDEMIVWRDLFKLNSFYFIDDNFLVNTHRAKEILHRAFENGMEVSQLLGHIQDFKPDILSILKTGKVSHVGFSIESASPRIQLLLNKPIDLKKVIDFVHFATNIGIEKITSNFMFGLPTEVDQDIAANIALATRLRDINPRVRTCPMIYTPQPEDDILTKFPQWKTLVKFNIENLSKIDFSPNRSKYLSPELRPWVEQEEIEFLVDLTQAWFFHFDYVVHEAQGIDIDAIYRRNKRLARLFRDVPMPLPPP